MSKKNLITISTIFVLMIISITVLRFGAFNDPNFTVIENHRHIVYGIEYKGKLSDKGFREAFKKIDQIAIKTKGSTIAHYYNNPDEEHKLVHCFVGVTNFDSSRIKGFELERRIIGPKKTLKASLEGYVFAGKMYDKAFDYAEENGLKVNKKNVTEIYQGDDNITLELEIVK